MAWTQTDIDRLKSAIATGALRVRYIDRDVTYRSLDEMRETLRMINAEVNAVPGRTATRQIRFQTDKGL